MRNHLKEAIEAMIDMATDDWRHRDIETNEFDGMEFTEAVEASIFDDNEATTLGDNEATTFDEDVQLEFYNYCLCLCHDIQAGAECEYCECNRQFNWEDDTTDEEGMDYDESILDEDEAAISEEDEVFNPFVGQSEDNPIILD